MEAIDVIDKTAQQLNINLDKRQDWIKPLALNKYIDERFHAMLHDVKVEEGLHVQLHTHNITQRHDDASIEEEILM